jgi:hypothetical protein
MLVDPCRNWRGRTSPNRTSGFRSSFKPCSSRTRRIWRHPSPFDPSARRQGACPRQSAVPSPIGSYRLRAGDRTHPVRDPKGLRARAVLRGSRRRLERPRPLQRPAGFAQRTGLTLHWRLQLPLTPRRPSSRRSCRVIVATAAGWLEAARAGRRTLQVRPWGLMKPPQRRWARRRRRDTAGPLRADRRPRDRGWALGLAHWRKRPAAPVCAVARSPNADRRPGGQRNFSNVVPGVVPVAVRSLGRSTKLLILMVPRGGIEPPTLRFSVACSTN